MALVQKYNDDPFVHGILVQLPLPDGIDPKVVTEAIDVTKDVDGYFFIGTVKIDIYVGLIH